MCLDRDGRWNEAEASFTQVLETRKRKLGADHPDTLTSLENLAFAWKGQGRDAEAVQLMEDCVQLLSRILGNGHPHFCLVRRWLNGKLRKQIPLSAELQYASKYLSSYSLIQNQANTGIIMPRGTCFWLTHRAKMQYKKIKRYWYLSLTSSKPGTIIKKRRLLGLISIILIRNY
jgi:hypothetical protein